MTDQATSTTAAEGRPFERRVRRPLGQAVRVSEPGERYHGTLGIVCEHVPAFGTVLYRVAAQRVREYGREEKREGWTCLFFPDQLRTQAHNAQAQPRAEAQP